MLVQTQVRPVTSCQPARRSATTPDPAAAARRRNAPRSASAKLETAKVAASTAKTTPGPQAATSTPASAGPAISATLADRLSSAFACWKRSLDATSGTSPVEAGEKNASAAP